MRIDIIAGARPNFIKISPIITELKKNKYNIKFRLIHTGQHYDNKLSGTFFNQLSIPDPDFNLGAGKGTPTEQTANIMIGYENILLKEDTDLCLVFGDVTSTMACAIVAKKKRIIVAHVEGGIRSFDNTMPEEINRILTDSISDFFFTTSKVAGKNLQENGIKKDKIFFVGNTMIDTLNKHRTNFFQPKIWNELSLIKKKYFVLTLHRPSNVDDPKILENLLSLISKNVNELYIIFPIHPRTEKKIPYIINDLKNFHIIKPLSYLEFNYLVQNSIGVITDSGGITEEASIMNVPCITLRENTERPETITHGTNILVGSDKEKIKKAFLTIFEGKWKKSTEIPLWDGRASKRIVEHIANDILI